jgi:hypothetical protein
MSREDERIPDDGSKHRAWRTAKDKGYEGHHRSEEEPEEKINFRRVLRDSRKKK